MAVHAYHPGTGADVVVTAEQLDHMRASGWMTRDEYEENQAAAAKAEAKDAAKSPAPKDASKG